MNRTICITLGFLVLLVVIACLANRGSSDDSFDAHVRHKMAQARAKGQPVLLSLNGLSSDPNLIFVSEEDGQMDGVCFMGPNYRVPWLTVYRNWTVDVNDPNSLTDASVRLLCESGRACEVMGHKYDMEAIESAQSMTCTLCGKVRLIRRLREWQE